MNKTQIRKYIKYLVENYPEAFKGYIDGNAKMEKFFIDSVLIATQIKANYLIIKEVLQEFKQKLENNEYKN